MPILSGVLALMIVLIITANPSARFFGTGILFASVVVAIVISPCIATEHTGYCTGSIKNELGLGRRKRPHRSTAPRPPLRDRAERAGRATSLLFVLEPLFLALHKTSGTLPPAVPLRLAGVRPRDGCAP